MSTKKKNPKNITERERYIVNQQEYLNKTRFIIF